MLSFCCFPNNSCGRFYFLGCLSSRCFHGLPSDNTEILLLSYNIISSDNVIVYRKSGGFFPLCVASQVFFFPVCFAACIALPLPAPNFTFTSQFLCIRTSFRAPAISPIFTTSGQFSIANKLLQVSSQRGTAFLASLAVCLCTACICFQLLMALGRA